MLKSFWFLNASTTCFFVSVTSWLSLISKKIVTSTKFKKNQKTVMKKTNITDEKLWMKIISYASKSTADSTIEFCQHSFLSSIYTGQIFQQLIFFDQSKISSAFFFIIDFIQINISTADFSKLNEIFVSILFYHWFVQVNIWSVSFLLQQNLR